MKVSAAELCCIAAAIYTVRTPCRCVQAFTCFTPPCIPGKSTMASCAFTADSSYRRCSEPSGMMLMPALEFLSQVFCSAAATAELPPNLKKIVGAFQMVSPLRSWHDVAQPGPAAICENTCRARFQSALPLCGLHQGHSDRSRPL